MLLPWEWKRFTNCADAQTRLSIAQSRPNRRCGGLRRMLTVLAKPGTDPRFRAAENAAIATIPGAMHRAHASTSPAQNGGNIEGYFPGIGALLFALSSSASRPFKISIGGGGQPGMCKSTGRISDTPPTTA